MSISLLEPVSLALGRTGKVLFRPFDFAKWVTLGFCAWLASLGEGNPLSSIQGRFPLAQGRFPAPNVPPGGVGQPGGPLVNNDFDLKPAADWIRSNLEFSVGITAAVVLFLVALSLLLTWLRAWGTFMFLDGVVRDRGAVSEPWSEYAREGNSLFRFMIVFGLVMCFLCALIVAGALAVAWSDLVAGRFGEKLATALVAFVPLFILVVACGGIASVFLEDFVVPIMYLRRTGVMAAWDEFSRSILTGHIGTMILYLLMRLLMGVVLSVIALFATCATCCLAGLPFVGSVVLLPLAVFERSYSLYVLEQYGAGWQILSARAKPKGPVFEDLPPSSV